MTDIKLITIHGVMITPPLVVNNEVRVSGKVSSVNKKKRYYHIDLL